MEHSSADRTVFFSARRTESFSLGRILPVLLSVLMFLFLPSALVALEPLSSREMRGVTGQEGIELSATDLRFSAASLNVEDEDGYAGGAESPGTLIMNNPTIGSTSNASDPFNINGVSINADESRGLTVDWPQFTFTFTSDGICIDEDAWPSCANAQTYGAGTFGSLKATNVQVNSSSQAEFQGLDSGLGINGTVDAQAESIRFDDGSGYPAGSNTAGFLKLGDGSGGQENYGIQLSASLDGTELHADGSKGVVVELPSNSGLNFHIDGIYPGASSSRIGSFEVSNLNFNTSRLSLRGHSALNDGLTMDASLDLSADKIEYGDHDASGFLTAQNVSITDGGNPLQGFSLDVDSSDGLVMEMPSSPSLEIQVGGLYLGDPAGASAGSLLVKNFELAQNEVRMTGLNDGLSLDMDLALDAEKLQYKDSTGWTNGSGDQGVLAVKDFFLGDIDGNDPYTLSNFDMHFEGSNNSVVLDLPTGSALQAEASGLYLGPSSTSAGSLELQGADLGDMVLKVSGHNDGFSVDSEFDVVVDELRLTDGNGTTNNSNSGYVAFGVDGGADFSINDGSGNPASLTNFTLDVDPTEGVVVDWFEGQATYNIGAILLGGSPSATSFTLVDGDMTGSTIKAIGNNDGASGNSGGLSLSGTLDVSAGAFQFSDNDGAPCLFDGNSDGTVECGDGGGTGTLLKLSGFDISDGSGNAATPNDGGASLSGAKLDFDATDGAVFTLPGGAMEISASSLSTGNAKFADGSPGYSINNLNLDNSWVKVNPH